ncbi:hypothetical protein [Paenibacillus whitsoniae]|uniref:Uncharacterized protein n=1 Tax=Paenibacillus whitsoniae TaxID=2496558 RepID=A0A430J5Q4_9BACL|nr:hypothetical protein [Paenibacillus whitsoniae]RTE02761.1 hypothetical protein EJQ19_29035 [Paenibacillus whitsoniae]
MLTLNEKEKKAIAQTINSKLDECLSKYPLAQYPDEPYEEWKRIFASPPSITPEHIKDALEWKYGHYGKHNNVKTHKRVIAKMQEHWEEFIQADAQDLTKIFAFWQHRLSDHPFVIPVTFVTHLMLPDLAANMDRQHFQAMNLLISGARSSWEWHSRPNQVGDVQGFTDFVNIMATKIEVDGDRKRMLDKFLRVFGGNMLILGKPATTGRRIEPAIKQFSWDTFAPKRFDRNKIVHRANADVLFACLLLTLEEDENEIAIMSINEISKRIPLGTAGISNYASFQYAMIALFSAAKGRNYFRFDNPDLTDAFTKQANNPSRDINFWKYYMSETVRISPDYVVSEIQLKE